MSDERMAEVEMGYEIDTGDRSYYQGKVECIDAIEAIIENQNLPAVEGYLVATTLKYLWRYNLKGRASEDLTKAAWFLDRLRKRVEERAAGRA